jgi:hypothetical protein
MPKSFGLALAKGRLEWYEKMLWVWRAQPNSLRARENLRFYEKRVEETREEIANTIAARLLDAE